VASHPDPSSLGDRRTSAVPIPSFVDPIPALPTPANDNHPPLARRLRNLVVALAISVGVVCALTLLF
jgi:hypothetical protein